MLTHANRARRVSAVPSPLFTSCAAGPAADPEGDVVVSVTDLSLARWRDVPTAAALGLRLRLGWYAMPGAVGLWLWSIPGQRRSGSVSVWAGEDDLRRFVGLREHVAIMRRYRDRGIVRAETWAVPRFVS